MRSLLGPEHYFSPQIFEREQQRIFRRLWIFAGLRTLVEANDALLTKTIGRVPILIQNSGGTLRAFVNQCAHRQARVQVGDYGQRRLACPYHGWVYSAEGRVKSIPGCDTLYGFSEQTITGLGLKKVHIECVGNLVFVNLDE